MFDRLAWLKRLRDNSAQQRAKEETARQNYANMREHN